MSDPTKEEAVEEQESTQVVSSDNSASPMGGEESAPSATEGDQMSEASHSESAATDDDGLSEASSAEEAVSANETEDAPAAVEAPSEPAASSSSEPTNGAVAAPAIPAGVADKPAQVVAAAAEAPAASASSDDDSEDTDSDEGEEEETEPAGPSNAFGVLNETQQQYPWYVVNTYSGFEVNAKKNLEERIRANNLVDKFGQILIPQETVVELVRGQKKTSTRKFFPGYMLVQCELDEHSWHIVNGTPKVTGFVGDPRNPSPLTEAEVENLVQQMEGGAARPRPKVQFEQGDAVKVIDGPFTDFNGTVDEVRPDKGKLRVLISIFGRNTPVELDFVQVEKA